MLSQEKINDTVYMNIASEIMDDFIKNVRRHFAIQPPFFPVEKEAIKVIRSKESGYEDNDYGDDKHFIISLPIPTVLRCFLDREYDCPGNEKIFKYKHEILYNYSCGYWTASSILSDPHVLAFALGLDDIRLRKPQSEKENLRESEREYPGYGKDYEKGRRLAEAWEKAGHYPHSSFRYEYFNICLVVSHKDSIKQKEDGPFKIRKIMAQFSENAIPHSDKRDWPVQIPLSFEGMDYIKKSLAEKIWEKSNEEQQLVFSM